MMIISLSVPLPCAQLVSCPNEQHPEAYCRHPAMIGVVAPVSDYIWELLPVCDQHAKEAMVIEFVTQDAAMSSQHTMVH